MILMKLPAFARYITLESSGECKPFSSENGTETSLCFVDFSSTEVESAFFVFCNVCAYTTGTLLNLTKVSFKLRHKVVAMLLLNILSNDDSRGFLRFHKNTEGVPKIQKKLSRSFTDSCD